MDIGYRLGVIAVVLLALAASPVRSEQTEPKGVNPKDNITKFDAIYTHDSFESDVDVDSLALKFDRALGPAWGVAVEVPLTRFSAPGSDASGVGDVNFRARYVNTHGRISYIAGGELVAPTASDDALGAGKWQLNPTVGAVFAVSQTSFVFAGYKHIASIGGDGERPDLNQSQPRLLGAITSPKGWWVLGDVKYTHDWNVETDVLDLEAEAGQMLSPKVALSLRVGTQALDGTKNSKLSCDLRYIF